VSAPGGGHLERPPVAEALEGPGPNTHARDRSTAASASRLALHCPIQILALLEGHRHNRARAEGPGWLGLRGWVQPRLDGLVGEAFDVGPPEAGGTGPPLNTSHRPQPDAQALGHLAVGLAQGPLLAQDLADLA
jgi:hypothetical protein